MDKRKRRLLCMLEGGGRKSRWISGAPPLSFKAFAAGVLENYRIYGNTIDGESVGDRTDNLFSSRLEKGSYDSTTGKPNVITNRVLRSPADDYIYLLPGNYNLSVSGVEYFTLYAYDSPDVNTVNSNLTITNWTQLPSTITINTGAYYKFAFRRSDYAVITPTDISNIMLNEGSTPLPYEPYGYKVPVTVSNGTDTLTTPIYLPEQIRKVGDYSDYIDYGSQKFVHRVVRKVFDGTEDIKYYGLFGTQNHKHFYYDIDGALFMYSTKMIAPWSNKYLPYKSWNGEAIGDRNIRYQYGYNQINPNRIYFTDDRFSSAKDFKTMLADWCANGDPLIVDYIIVEPVEEQVTLPALSVLPGTNVLSVGTAVQPSKIEVKGKIKAL